MPVNQAMKGAGNYDSQTGVTVLLIAEDDGGFVGSSFCPVGNPAVEIHCWQLSGFEISPASELLQLGFRP
jgi:hypothetical protein